MENASKALIIAAEILIALIIITAIVMGFTSLRDLQNEEKSTIHAEQLAVFNKEYESYNRKLLRGVDVISVMNRAIDNNKKYDNEEYYRINIEFKMTQPIVFTKEGKSKITFKTNIPYNMNEFSTISDNIEAFTDFKRRVFDCIDVKYGEMSGRVNYMLFQERKLSNDEYMSGI